MPPPRRILIIKPSSLGDVVHALPVLAALRAAYPEAHIAWLVSTSFVPLLEDHPLLNEVIPFDRRLYGRMLRSPHATNAFIRFTSALRRREFDLVLDLQGLFRSGFLARATGAARRIGFAAAREMAWMFYTERVTCPDADEHAVLKNMRLVAAAGASATPIEFPLGLRPEELAATRERLDAAADRPIDGFTAVLPGARWPSKLWPVERHAALLDALADEGRSCVLLGSPAERELAAAIIAGATHQPVDLVGRTSLRELAALLAISDLVICQDSGPMHIAAALGKPVVALFGPTSPARTGPYCPAARVVTLSLECAPCYSRTCPFGHQRCLRDLEVDRVLRAVREITLLEIAEPT